ncbi:hypothetical protein Peur_054818 [Populus x canadensis]
MSWVDQRFRNIIFFEIFSPSDTAMRDHPLPTSVVLELLAFLANGQPNLHDCLSRKRSSEKSTCNGSSGIATNSSPGDSGRTCKGCNRTQSKPLKSGNWLV